MVRLPVGVGTNNYRTDDDLYTIKTPRTVMN